MADITKELTYLQWLRAADDYSIGKWGISVTVLSYPWFTAYQTGKLPTAAAREACAE